MKKNLYDLNHASTSSHERVRNGNTYAAPQTPFSVISPDNVQEPHVLPLLNIFLRRFLKY